MRRLECRGLVCKGLVCKGIGTQDGFGMQRVDMQGVGT